MFPFFSTDLNSEQRNTSKNASPKIFPRADQDCQIFGPNLRLCIPLWGCHVEHLIQTMLCMDKFDQIKRLRPQRNKDCESAAEPSGLEVAWSESDQGLGFKKTIYFIGNGSWNFFFLDGIILGTLKGVISHFPVIFRLTLGVLPNFEGYRHNKNARQEFLLVPFHSILSQTSISAIGSLAGNSGILHQPVTELVVFDCPKL